MTFFIPPYLGEEIKSNAEKKIYNVLQALEGKEIYVLHSLGLPRHQSKIYGEVDFVVVCERGVACLEIKGGRVECREGNWYFTDRYGTERRKAEGPFAQVIGNMFSLRETLKQRFPNNPHIHNLLLASGVMFPDIEFYADSQEIIPDIVYDINTANITQYMNQVFDYWQRRYHREPSKLPPRDIKEIVNYLRGEFTFIPSLASRLDSVESKLLRLTAEQVQVMEALSANPHLLIEGNAGTGKTLLAINFAKRQAALGKRILYLTFNKNLANYVRGLMGEADNLTVINIHALFGLYVQIEPEKIRLDSQHYFYEELPEIFYEYITALSGEELQALQYDALIMDEGQDILRPSYMYSLDCLLKGGLDKGIWAVFYDEKQNIYNPDYQNGMEVLQTYPCTRFRLFMNCRNTVQIGVYSEKVSGFRLGDFIRENGEEVRQVSYEDEDSFQLKITGILKELKKGKVLIENVTFLSPKRYKNSIMSRVNIPVNEVGDGFAVVQGLPVYATIQGYKGLDAQIIILVDVGDIRKEAFSKYIYIAATRARTLLYIVGEGAFWENHSMPVERKGG